ncbi:hypothetical protein [Orrella sp. 11846]|uniref:hypothetical protein n=1 Tax=Orrella sp. 11846 TaxID=3409913 RepID=UPI003B5B212A
MVCAINLTQAQTAVKRKEESTVTLFPLVDEKPSTDDQKPPPSVKRMGWLRQIDSD